MGDKAVGLKERVDNKFESPRLKNGRGPLHMRGRKRGGNRTDGRRLHQGHWVQKKGEGKGEATPGKSVDWAEALNYSVQKKAARTLQTNRWGHYKGYRSGRWRMESKELPPVRSLLKIED